MSYQSGSSSINGSVSVSQTLPGVPTGATLISKYVDNQTSGQTIHTTTVGKTFYCLGAVASSTSAQRVGFSVAGTRKLSSHVAVGAQAVFTGGILFSAAAGEAIQTYASSNVEFYGCVWGYEI